MPTPQRPMPSDFIALSKTIGTANLCRHYSAGSTVVARWRREAGIAMSKLNGRVPTPLPADFTSHAPAESNRQLADRYQTSMTMITRWRREAGIPSSVKWTAGRPRPKRVRPDDFAERAPHMTNKALCAHYRAKPYLVERWRSETGARYIRPVKEPRRRIYQPREKPVQQFTRQIGQPIGKPVPPPDGTMQGQAAHFLRSTAPVYRCDRRGRAEAPDVAKAFWRYGNVLLTPDEMMQRAASKGWTAA